MVSAEPARLFMNDGDDKKREIMNEKLVAMRIGKFPLTQKR